MQKKNPSRANDMVGSKANSAQNRDISLSCSSDVTIGNEHSGMSRGRKWKLANDWSIVQCVRVKNLNIRAYGFTYAPYQPLIFPNSRAGIADSIYISRFAIRFNKHFSCSIKNARVIAELISRRRRRRVAEWDRSMHPFSPRPLTSVIRLTANSTSEGVHSWKVYSSVGSPARRFFNIQNARMSELQNFFAVNSKLD